MGFVADIFVWLTNNPSFLIVGLLLYVFIFVLSVIFSGPKPGPNPFKVDTSRQAKPLVLDSAVRDKVLKQAFHVKRVPDNLDAIVIGSGIGGLSTAAILARAGKKVLVLEQHDQAGGCCHVFEEKGFEFDVGIHYVGELRNNTLTKLYLNQLTDGQLQWCDLIEEFDVVALGEPGSQKMYPFHAGGPAAWKKAMMKLFPGEEKALDKYLFYLKDVRANMMGHVSVKFMSKWAVRILINTGLIHRFTKYFKYAERSLQDVMNEITDNDDLKAVLSYSYGDYGNKPKDASFAMHASLINHYLYGASYPRGGASEIAFHIIPVIEKAFGRVLVRAPVTKVLFDSNGRANGVRVGKTSGDVDIFARTIISDAGVVNTFKSLIPPEIAQKSGIHRLIREKKIGSGVGCMSLFVGLKGTAEELGLQAQNIWAFTDNNLERITSEYLEGTGEDAGSNNIPLVFISFPSTKDPTYNTRYPGKTACTVVTLANWEWFEKWSNERVMKRGADYESIKNNIGRRIWDQTVALFPQLEDKVEYFNVGSPVTNQFYINSAKGEIYGLDHDVKRFGDPEVVSTLRPDTDIPGLVLTGQDVLSCGFTGAMFGGLLCASHVLHRNTFDDLVALKKQVGKSK